MFKIDDTYQVELIEAYLSGAMTGAERELFESQLADDATLRQQVKLHRLTLAALQAHGRHEDATLSEALKGMTRDGLMTLLEHEHAARYDRAACVSDSETPQQDTHMVATLEPGEDRKSLPPRHRRGAWWQVLAAAALVTGVWFSARSFYMQKMAHRADQKITDTYIAMRESGEKATGTARGDNEVFMQRHKELTDTLDIAQVAPTPDSIEVVMQQAMFAMRNDMTGEAIRLLEPLYQQSGMNKEVGIALAMAYVKAEQRDKAVTTLNAMNKRYDGDPEIEELLKILVD